MSADSKNLTFLYWRPLTSQDALAGLIISSQLSVGPEQQMLTGLAVLADLC